MTISLYTIASSLHQGLTDAAEEKFITDIENSLGVGFDFRGDDFSSYGKGGLDLIYVRTGGTEGIFKSLGLKGYVRLLASGKRNSLAAAMEILSYIRSRGGQGEILHGSADHIAGRLKAAPLTEPLAEPLSASGFLRELPKVDFGGARLGVIGRPSDWLIASDVDYAAVRNRLGIELVDIDIAELVSGVKAAVSGHTTSETTVPTTPETTSKLASFSGSEAIYEVLKRMAAEYRLSGLTLRCFDLLDSLGNTGCLALARLNSEGIPSSCEGDIPALITMMLAQKLTGCPGFQCNLSRISGTELLFAHCTVPLSMVSSFRYDSHFESGIGTAIKGELPEGEVRILKVAPDLSCMADIPARLVRNQSEPGLCRTQVILDSPGAADYFLRTPLANHHVIVPVR